MRHTVAKYVYLSTAVAHSQYGMAVSQWAGRSSTRDTVKASLNQPVVSIPIKSFWQSYDWMCSSNCRISPRIEADL
jgi:hypothetical protein